VNHWAEATVLRRILYVGFAIALIVYLAATVDEDDSLVWLIAVFPIGHAAFGLAFGRWRALALVRDDRVWSTVGLLW
jgi:hypothetical protein